MKTLAIILFDFFEWFSSNKAQAITTVIGYVSGISGAVAYIKSRRKPHKYMLGRWQGPMDKKIENNKTIVIDCILVITPNHEGKNYKALFFYEYIDHINGFKGLDISHNFDLKSFKKTRTWKVKFYRKFHIHYWIANENNKTYNEYREIRDGTSTYDWECTLVKDQNSDSIEATIKGNDATFKGKFDKT